MSSQPIYNGTDFNDQPLVDAWWTRGWTSQNDDYVVAAEPSQTPNFPSNLVVVAVTGAYFSADGNPLPGFLTFKMSDNITVQDPSGTYFRLPARYAGRQNDGSAFAMNNWGNGRIFIWKGQVSVLLFATDNPGITTDSGNPLTYTVTEHFLDGRQFSITAPGASMNPVDINTLIVPGSVAYYDFNPADPLGSGSVSAPVPVPTFSSPPSSSGPESATWVQSSASVTWTIVHNLGFNPGGITVLDNSGTVWIPESIVYTSVNQLVLTFVEAVAGTAYLS